MILPPMNINQKNMLFDTFNQKEKTKGKKERKGKKKK